MGLLTEDPVPPGFTGTRIGVCNLCEAICGVELTITDGAVTGIRGNDKDPLSRGYICPKGVSLADVHADPDRLRRPVRRMGRGAEARWEEISWDEALDLVAERLAATIREHGANAVGVYLGNPNAHSLGFATHGTAFVKALRTRNRFSASTVDQIPHQFVAWQLFGHQLLLPVPDIDRTDHFLVLGANPMASNGSLMTVPDFPNRVRELKARGGRMVVLDPRRTETAKVATEHHFVRPGSDAAVLLAMLNVLLADGLTTPPSYVDNVDRVRELVAEFTPERAELASGLPADTVRRLARDFAAADRAAAYGRMGLSTQSFGSVCQWAIQLLNLLTGNFDREGGVLFPEPAVDTVGRRIVGPGHHDVWRSRVRQVPEFAGELPAATMREEITTPGEGRIRAMVTIAGNPVLSTPDGSGLAEALDGLDFMVAIDIYLNETTRHADVILPTTSALERDQYDVLFHGFAVRNTARYTPAVFAKPENARHDWEIFGTLAERLQGALGAGLKDRLATRARFAPSPAAIVTGLLRTGGQTTMRALRRHPEGVDLGPLRPTMPDRLQTETKRIDLAPELLVADLPRLSATLDGADPLGAGELLLIGRRHKQDCNSWLHNTERLTRGRPRHHLLMHPKDLAERGIEDGALVRVSSRVGSVDVEVSGADDMMPGVVSLPHGYGHQVAGTGQRHAATVAGVSINDLTDPDRLDVSGNAALNGVPVTVQPA
ncbi:MAG TPA: molybdopterin-dependent oxidoreductase [Nocardioides sp.]|uniref:molybdopterin-dependent oxidoreductase n=1 Tax=Nocardioides sp. TaxID=35761 RepID=UPI002E320131|nr:molybdopterin-dependent oxidoreductase [Nocardioides sp.]HEX5090479.1 molybdopterin-dependent oxidoreductase [Nocardioides sp.]